jgi:hypothetical protein
MDEVDAVDESVPDRAMTGAIMSLNGKCYVPKGEKWEGVDKRNADGSASLLPLLINSWASPPVNNS